MLIKLTTYRKTVLIWFVILVLSLATYKVALAESCTVNCLSVYSNTLTDRGGSIRGIVKLIDETRAGAGARGSVVHAIWTRPDGSTFDQYARIGTRLRATFNLYTAGIPGTYTLIVAGATKSGYTFDPANSSLLDSSISVGDAGNQAPTAIANADVTSGSVPLTVNFDSTGSADKDGMIVTYEWDFGDGNRSSNPFPSHTYMDIGNFTTRLTVTDNEGMTASQTTSITISGITGDCLINCISVDNVSLRYQKKSDTVKGQVWLVDENNSGVSNAQVHATWTLPDGTTIDQHKKTGKRSKVSFRLTAEQAGTYKLTVVKITKPDYSFDMDNSIVLDGMINIAP